MKKIICLLLAWTMTFSMVACDGGNAQDGNSVENSAPSSSSSPAGDENEPVYFEMDTETKTIEKYQPYKIKYELRGNKELTWVSSNPSVATVENGVVTGVGEGTAYIGASVDNFSYMAEIVVGAASEEPVIRVNKEIVSDLKTLETFDLEAYLTYKRYDIDVEIEVESEDPTIVEANGLTLTGKGVGSTNVILRAFYCGQEFRKEIPVVVNLNAALVRDKSKVELYLYPHSEGQSKTDKINVTALLNKEPQAGVGISYVSSDPSVVEVSSDGTVTAKNIGAAVVTATGNVGGVECSVSVDVSVKMETIVTGRSVVVDTSSAGSAYTLDVSQFTEIDVDKIQAITYEGKTVNKVTDGGAIDMQNGIIGFSDEFVQSVEKNKRYALNISLGEVYYQFNIVFAFKYDMWLIHGRRRYIILDSASVPKEGQEVIKSNFNGESVYKLSGSVNGDLSYNPNSAVYGFPSLNEVDTSLAYEDLNDSKVLWRSMKIYFESDFTGIFQTRVNHHQIKYDNFTGKNIVYNLTWNSGDIYAHDTDTCIYIYDESGKLVNNGHEYLDIMRPGQWYTIEIDLTHRLWFDQWYEDPYFKVYQNMNYYVKDVQAYDTAYRTNVLGR